MFYLRSIAILGAGLLYGVLGAQALNFDAYAWNWIRQDRLERQQALEKLEAQLEDQGLTRVWAQGLPLGLESEDSSVMAAEISLGSETLRVHIGTKGLEARWSGRHRAGQIWLSKMTEYRSPTGRFYYLLKTPACSGREWRQRRPLLVEIPRDEASAVFAIDERTGQLVPVAAKLVWSEKSVRPEDMPPLVDHCATLPTVAGI